MDYPADRPMGHDVDFVGICFLNVTCCLVTMLWLDLIMLGCNHLVSTTISPRCTHAANTATGFGDIKKIYAGLPGEIENHGRIFTCKIFFVRGSWS